MNRFKQAFMCLFLNKRYNEYLRAATIKEVEKKAEELSKDFEDKFSLLANDKIRNGLHSMRGGVEINQIVLPLATQLIKDDSYPECSTPTTEDTRKIYRMGKKVSSQFMNTERANVTLSEILAKELIDRGFIHAEFISSNEIMYCIYAF